MHSNGTYNSEVIMAFWKRFLITIVAMLVASFVVGLIWKEVFSSNMPGYLSGVVGGLMALPVWEFLKRFKPKEKKTS
jgi:hypothetical protein